MIFLREVNIMANLVYTTITFINNDEDYDEEYHEKFRLLISDLKEALLNSDDFVGDALLKLAGETGNSNYDNQIWVEECCLDSNPPHITLQTKSRPCDYLIAKICNMEKYETTCGCGAYIDYRVFARDETDKYFCINDSVNGFYDTSRWVAVISRTGDIFEREIELFETEEAAREFIYEEVNNDNYRLVETCWDSDEFSGYSYDEGRYLVCEEGGCFKRGN